MGIREIDSRHTATVLKFQGKEMGISKSEISPNRKVLKVEGTSREPMGKSKRPSNTGTRSNGGTRTGAPSFLGLGPPSHIMGVVADVKPRRTLQIEQRKAHVVRTLHECMRTDVNSRGKRIVRVPK